MYRASDASQKTIEASRRISSSPGSFCVDRYWGGVHCRGMTNDKPKFKAGDMVQTEIGERLRVTQCDLWGCTVDNGTLRGARYSPERLKLISRKEEA